MERPFSYAPSPENNEVLSSPTIMNPAGRYSYDNPPPRRLLAQRSVSVYPSSLMRLARNPEDTTFIGLIVTSVAFAVLAEILLIRRSAFPRVLELTDRAILFNWGHLLWARIVAVHFADITRIRVWPDAFTMVTSRGEFTIGAARFRDREHYRAVRQFVSTKTAIVLPEQEPSRWAGFPFHRDALPVECPPCPPPLIHWVAPADWERFRRHVVKSKPVSAHLRRELWFFGRCLGFFLFPGSYCGFSSRFPQPRLIAF